MNYWLIKGQPKRNNFDERLLRTSPDVWETKKLIPSDMACGDRVFLYESSPNKCLVAFAKVANPHSGQSESYNNFTLTYLTQRFRNTIHQDEIRRIPGLENPSFLKSGNAGTIYRLRDDEPHLLLQAIIDRNPELTGFWSTDSSPTEESVVEPFEMEEGNLILRTHLERERKPALVAAKKAEAKSRLGSLVCEVCDFDFSYNFEARGRDFCEVHHRYPLSKTPPSVNKLEDLAIVCANCHRMLHREPWTTVEELRAATSRMRPVLQYKGHEGSVLFSTEDHLLHGKILHIRSVYIYGGSDIETIEKHFRESVDDYLGAN